MVGDGRQVQVGQVTGRVHVLRVLAAGGLLELLEGLGAEGQLVELRREVGRAADQGDVGDALVDLGGLHLQAVDGQGVAAHVREVGVVGHVPGVLGVVQVVLEQALGRVTLPRGEHVEHAEEVVLLERPDHVLDGLVG